jgi:hypothetical protein
VEADFDPAPILETLTRHGVDFVLIGGLAGVAMGSAFQTSDVDIAYARTPNNLERLAVALRELDATLRGAPDGLPFQLDAKTLHAGANFTFATKYGPLDILGDPAGAPPFETLRAGSEAYNVSGVTIAVTSIDHLIAMKQAAGRPRDKLMVSEYELLADELKRAERER